MVKMAIMLFVKAVLGPKLYRIYQHGNEPGHFYVANSAESFADSVLKWVKICWSICWWASPVILTIMYRKGTFTFQGMTALGTYAIGVSVLVSFAIFVRTFGRLTNLEYRTFLQVLTSAQNNNTAEAKSRLSEYDFDFNAWPIDFSARMISTGAGSKEHSNTPAALNNSPFSSQITSLPINILSYLCVHTFGRRMLYPGSLSIIQSLMSSALMTGRAKLIEENHGVRAKLRTEDGNDIDTMFVNRRKTGNENGKILVICSEGNSGFYEVGCMCTPLEAGYSVLGWNHPGFWGSTGIPVPSQEQSAIDAVMQYSIRSLGFEPSNIILFAWSIGGYAATWAAMSYPDVRGVILDATFDDIKPLAIAKMPPSWKPLVETTISTYLNLNNAELLCKYPGPILLIRRSKDEMITTVDQSVISSNRGNDLLVQLLRYRYPCIVDDSTIPSLKQWLELDNRLSQVHILREIVDEVECIEIFESYFHENSSIAFPSQIGKDLNEETKIHLTYFLANKYMEDYDSTHCTPLPADRFRQPWNPLPASFSKTKL